MKCPECQFENRAGVKFCENCGNKFEIECPNCKAKIPPDRKFCGECGHNITQPSEAPPKELSFDEKIEKIQKYLPKGLTDKILSQRDRIEGENKQVTVMFADMEGFTPLVNKVGPEEAYSIMDEIYEILIHKVHDYEGTVNEMTGDGIMALFGAPIAIEDAPQRAIRSAHAVHREMTRFNDKIKQEKEGIQPLKMRIGIHTGPVVVGTLGNDLRVEFKAVGDTVNLASRMEDLAEPGSTYVSEETFKLTEGLFRYESLGEKEVKGKEEPVKTYRVIGPSTRRTRFDVSAERGLTPFIGREKELELLIDGFERAKQGRGQAFSIMGEAGVGKSRMSYEFRKRVENEDVTFLEGKCLSYSQGVAYHPIIDLYKSNFDIRDNDSDDQIREKVKKGLKLMDIDEASTLPYLLELLSVKDSGIDQIPMSPEGKKDRMIETIIRIPLKGSEIRPLIMVIEDLHWMDKSSEDVLKYMLESISGARILLIFTYRPEFVHTWGGRSYHNQVNLNRLSNRESLAMVSHLLGTEDIESDLENLLLEKTEGIPFFIEEFLKSFKDLKVIERKDNRYHLIEDIQDLAIPSTIQDVIMARVDSLPEGAKEVLQTGSVIEREFSYDLIREVTGQTEQELMSHFSVLRDSELLYERGIYPQSTHIFKHALTREVAYDSILTKRRRRLHEEIGNAIEGLYKNNIDEHYGVLAEHYITSGNYEKGAKYCKLTLRKVEKTASFPDMIAFGEKRVSCLEKLIKTEDVQKEIIDARTILGLYYIQLNFHIDAKDAVQPIIDIVQKLKYKRRLSQIYTIMGSYYFMVEEDFSKAFECLEDALAIAIELNDINSLSMANYWLGLGEAFDCRFEKASTHMGKTLEINEFVTNLWGISTLKSMLSDTIFSYRNIDLALKTSTEAIEIAEKSGDIYSKAWAYGSYGQLCLHRGSMDEAMRYLLKGVPFIERVNLSFWHSWVCFIMGETCFEKMKYQESQVYYGKAIQLLEVRVRILPSLLNLCKICLEKAKVMRNKEVIDPELLYRYIAENKVKLYDGWMRRSIGAILLYIDDQHMVEADNWINKAIESDKKNGMMWCLGRDYALYAELFKRKGDKSKAKENLGKAIEILTECGADGWVEKYEKELASL